MDNQNRYTDGDYLKNNPGWHAEDAGWKAAAIDQLLKKNQIQPKEITEIGCGSGAVLHELSKLNKNISSLKGYDISPQAISIAGKINNHRLSFYQDDLLAIKDFHSEVLLMIDVLEHIEDYTGFLNQLKSKSNYFVFHIPLDLSNRTLMKPAVLLQQRESVGHIHYFTKDTIEWALKDAGYEIKDWIYTKPVTDIEPAKNMKRGIKKILRNLSFAIFPNWSAKMWGNYSILYLLK